MSQQPCFAVSKKRRIVDPTQEISFQDIDQMDAQTYLSRVVAQASQLPEHFTVKTTSTTKNKNNHHHHHHSKQATATALSAAASIAHLLSPAASLTPPSSTAVLPAAPRKWVDAVCADFTRLRDYLEKILILQGRTTRKRTFAYTLPTLKDRAAWHVFCVGPAEAQGNVAS